MARMGLQGLWQAQPVFHDLGREFDKIAKHRRAGLRWIARAAHQPMQRMAEFMEQRARLIEGKQGWCGAGQVVVIDDDGRGAFAQPIGHAKTAHPGAGAFAGAGIIIKQQKPNMASGLIQGFKATQIGVVARNIGAFFEAQAEKPPSRIKHRAQHGFQFEMRLQRGAIEIMLGPTGLFRPIAPIPGLDRAIMAAGAGKGFKFSFFIHDAPLGGFPTGAQQGLSRFR